MADTGDGHNPAQQASIPPQTDPRSMRVRLDTRDQADQYVNVFRTGVTRDELMLEIGVTRFNIVDDGEGRPEQELVMRLPTRCIMNFNTAKRLALSLGRLVRDHEQKHGEITTEPSPGGGTV